MPYISLSKQGNQTLQKGQYEMEALVMFQNGAKTGEMLTATNWSMCNIYMTFTA